MDITVLELYLLATKANVKPNGGYLELIAIAFRYAVEVSLHVQKQFLHSNRSHIFTGTVRNAKPKV